MSPATRVTEADITKVVQENALFDGLSEAYRRQVIAALTKGVRYLKAGEELIREGSPATELFLIHSGSLEVRKQEHDGNVSHGLVVLGPGMSIGEIALLDKGPRSATVVAIEPSTVLVYDVGMIEGLGEAYAGHLTTIKLNLARDLARKLRVTNELAVDYLRQRLAEAQLRVEMGRFISRMLFGVSLYVFSMGLGAVLARRVTNTSFITTPIAFILALFFVRILQTSPYPISEYGLTLSGWRQKSAEAILFSIPVAIVIVAVKALLIHVVPSMHNQPLLDMGVSGGLSTSKLAAYALLYAAVTPVQEMCTRGGIQSSLQLFLTGKYKVLQAILLSNLMFSLVHVHMSIVLAAMVFPVGLFWGWLFYRQKSLISVSVSHALIGVFALFVVGFQAAF